MAIIVEEVGDIFLAPPRSLLIHACNARGAWGSGVAVAFKQNHPDAFRKYNAHCLSPPSGSKLSVRQHQANIVGTTLLIGPSDTSNQRQAPKTPHYIGCLFTSLDYGKRVSPAKEILKNTENALKDLARQVAEMKKSDGEVGSCYAVRINSGKFGVEWQKTKAVLEAGDLDVTVLRPRGEGGADGAGTAAGGKCGQSPVVSSGAEGSKPTQAAGAEARITFDMQNAGRKRRRKVDGDEDDGVHQNVKRRLPSQKDQGIAKRKKLA